MRGPSLDGLSLSLDKMAIVPEAKNPAPAAKGQLRPDAALAVPGGARGITAADVKARGCAGLLNALARRGER